MVEKLSDSFHYADCPLKHYVRRNGWLPFCKSQLHEIRKQRRSRRLRYFTFCAVEAVEVLMLEHEKVLKRNKNGEFDTVVFFAREEEAVAEILRKIRGARGFDGSFAKIVTLDDREWGDSKAWGVDEAKVIDTKENRLLVRRKSARIRFEEEFPFDVINFDLEGTLFPHSDVVPGRYVAAFRKVFEWQRKPLDGTSVNGFVLMFTTRIIDPEYLPDHFKSMLNEAIDENTRRDASLVDVLLDRTGLDSVKDLADKAHAFFYSIATPKILIAALHESDWYVDSTVGIKAFEFQRTRGDGHSYTMLHFVMQIRRKNPPVELRSPGDDGRDARAAYKQVVRNLFGDKFEVVEEPRIDVEFLKRDLRRLRS